MQNGGQWGCEIDLSTISIYRATGRAVGSLSLDCVKHLAAYWSKTHKRLKEHFLIGRNRTKCASFWGSPLFQAMYNMKKEKQTIQLILCQLDVGGWWKEKGLRLLKIRRFSPVLSNWKAFSVISYVFWIFFQNAGSQLCFRLFYIYFFRLLIGLAGKSMESVHMT